MAQYTVQDTTTGKNVTFEWTHSAPPTDADMEEVFAAARGGETPFKTKEEYAADPAFMKQRAEFLKREGTLGTRVRNTPVKDMLYNVAAEVPRLGKEMLTVPVQSGKVALAGAGLIGDLTMSGRGLTEDQISQKQQEWKEWGQRPVIGSDWLEPSMVGEAVSYATEEGKKGAEKLTGDTGLASTAIDATMNTMGLAGLKGVAPLAKGAGKLALKVYDKASPTTGAPKVDVPRNGLLEPLKQEIYNSRNPKYLENLFDTNASKVAKPRGKAVVDKVERARDAVKERTAIDEIDRQTKAGEIGEVAADGTFVPHTLETLDAGGVSGGYQAATQALKNVWDKEINPVLQANVKAGKKASTAQVRSYLESEAARLQEAGIKVPAEIMDAIEFYKQNPELDLNSLQTRIAEKSHTLDFDKMTTEQKTAAVRQLQETKQLRKLLDDTVETGLEGVGMSDLKGVYGALRQHADRLAEATFNQLKKEHSNTWGRLDNLAGIEAVHGLMLANPAMIKGALSVGALKAAMSRIKSPDVALQRMRRARRALNQGKPERVPAQAPNLGEAPPALFNPEVPGNRFSSVGDTIVGGRVGLGLEEGGIPPRVTPDVPTGFNPEVAPGRASQMQEVLQDPRLYDQGGLEAGGWNAAQIGEQLSRPRRIAGEYLEPEAPYRPEQMPTVIGSRPAGLEEGGRRFEHPDVVRRPQTVVSAESLPGRQSSAVDMVGNRMQNTIGLEEGGHIPPRMVQSRVANPEVVPGRQSSAVDVVRPMGEVGLEQGAQPPSHLNPRLKEMGLSGEQAMNLTTDGLKAAIKQAGGGKAGVEATAKTLGVTGAVLTAYLLTKDEKIRRELLMQYPQLKGL